MNTTAPPLVLVVEDEPAIADLLRSYLVRDGFAVEISSDGVAALAAVARRRPAAVILDVGLPGIDGTEVCRRMRSGGDWTPVLFVTARDDEVDRVVDDASQSVVLLAQPAARAVVDTTPPRGRLLVPLLLGLIGGALAGLLLARQTARPLARLAGAARWLSAGRRDVRVPVEGPAEVADAAQALNSLAAALDDSEQRQRRFLLMVSHELRTPLTAVTGYAEALADGVLPPDEVPRAGAVIRDEAARLQRRVEDLLALARMEADDFRVELADADLAALLRTAGRAWEPRADAAGVRLLVDAPSWPVVVSTDAECVRQAVDALVDNALRVLPAGVPLVLAVRAADRGVRVEVRDGGEGLSDDDLAVAFERGRLTERYRGDRPVGSGLGLALVGELAKRLGGYAEAYPASEGGVAFALVLPAAPDRAASPSFDEHLASHS